MTHQDDSELIPTEYQGNLEEMSTWNDSVIIMISFVSGAGLGTVRKFARGEKVAVASEAAIRLAMSAVIKKDDAALSAARDRVMMRWKVSGRHSVSEDDHD